MQSDSIVTRRQFGATVAAASVAAASGTLKASDETASFVTSEVGRLKRVLIHPPKIGVAKSFPMYAGDHAMLTWELLRRDALAEHTAFVSLLKQSGADVVLFEDVLHEAVEAARKSEDLKLWIAKAAPGLVDLPLDGITARALLGGDDRLVYRRDASGAFAPLIEPASTMFFTRDLAVMTPRGLVLANLIDRRSFETVLTKFVFQHAPSMKRYPILLDAMEQSLELQGGDVMVADANTLFVGIGNATETLAAIELAKKTKMDVVTVQMPSQQWFPGEWDGLQAIFYHLDCLINFVRSDLVLAVPYLLEREHVSRSPLLDVLYGLARVAGKSKADRVAMMEEVRQVGWVKRYKAGTGERDQTVTGLKLVDYLRKLGKKVTFVGGSAPQADNSADAADAAQNADKPRRPVAIDADLQHVVEVVSRECRFMAMNIVATADNKIVAYQDNRHTLKALRAAGAEVSTFPSAELERANGGPHCLTMPLERD